MKKCQFLIGISLSLAFLLLGCVSSPGAQPATTTEIAKVVQTNKSANEVFDLSMKWMNETFGSAKAVIQFSDKASGMITGKAIDPAGMGRLGELTYTLTIEVKDNKARLSFNALSFDVRSGYQTAKGTINQYIFDQFTGDVEKITDNYTQYITTHTADF